ncbi:MAG: disulfide bond formation protein B [Proteobacteria bacterium]|nr:disulfide bond formation protein B [Pseudomonadota bacterium]
MSLKIFDVLHNNITNLTARRMALLAALISLFALATAYTAEYGFGLKPCILCLYQRVPFAVVAVLGLVAFLINTPYTRLILAFCGLAFLTGSFIAFFHSGVELHWWAGTDSCVTKLDASSVEAIRAQIMGTKAARCDEIQWSFLGLSMANYNVLMSGGLAALTFLGLRLIKKDS